MSIRTRLIVVLVIVLGGIIVTGCQTYPYSELENEVYNSVNKFSQKMPKGWAKHEINAMPGQYIYQEPTVVLSNTTGSGKFVGGVFNLKDVEGACSVTCGHVDFDTVSHWLESRGADEGPLKPGSLVYFAFLNAEASPSFGDGVVLLKDQGAVVYRRLRYKWTRVEMQNDKASSRDYSSFVMFPLEHFEEQPAQEVAEEQVQRYLDLANRFASTYYKEQILY